MRYVIFAKDGQVIAADEKEIARLWRESRVDGMDEVYDKDAGRNSTVSALAWREPEPEPPEPQLVRIEGFTGQTQGLVIAGFWIRLGIAFAFLLIGLPIGCMMALG